MKGIIPGSLHDIGLRGFSRCQDWSYWSLASSDSEWADN